MSDTQRHQGFAYPKSQVTERCDYEEQYPSQCDNCGVGRDA